MKKILSVLLIFLSGFLMAQTEDNGKWKFEGAVNISEYSSLSISLEREYTYKKITFGPRVELVNPFSVLTYQIDGDTNIYQQFAQIRLRLLQVEWEASDRIKIGIAPFWMLGPLPRRGYYKTPSSAYVHFDLDKAKTLSSEISISTNFPEIVLISFRKVF